MNGDWLGIAGRAAIVTGGASGIGRACCEALGRSGMKILVADFDRNAGEETAAWLRGTIGTDAAFALVDVARKEQCEAMADAAMARFGRIDVLVNNAGINIPRLLVDPAGKEELTESIWDSLTAVNQKGVFLCAQAVARRMQAAGRGVVINMASESGMEGSEGQSAYSASKAALYGLTRSWAKELGRHGIRVVGVAPGILEATGLRSDRYENALAYTRGITVEALRAGYEKVSTIPLGRVGKLSEVADVVAFLASDRAGYIHGTVINVSGGKSRG